MSKKPRKPLKILTAILLVLYAFTLATYPVYSDDINDLENEIEQKENEIEEKEGLLADIESRIADISNSNYSLSQKINMINEEIADLQEIIEEKEAEIDAKLEEIEIKQEDLSTKKVLLDEISSELYMESRYNFSQFLISNGDWDDFVENIFVKKSAISFLKDEIEKINSEFTNLAESKAELDKEKEDLDKERKELDESYDLLAKEKSKLQGELNSQYASKNTVSGQISALNKEVSELQEYLLIAKSGGTVVDANSVPNSSSDSSLSYFRSNAPSGSFGVFSFGAYTHRNGMSQWGARARADAGQSYTQILDAYYPGKSIRTGSVIVNGSSESITNSISVNGYGTLNFEDYYLLGIKEIPESWDIDVLKAQAIAARTYAVRYTNNGRGSICTTESCQVFGTPLKSGAWKTAVEQTAGMILVNSNGTPASTQYAAVHGGWGNTVGWDTTTGNGSGDWIANSWESKSGVSWFYRNWFRNGYSDSGGTCGHNPWLTMEEMSDIVNAYLLWKQNGEPDSDPRIVSVDVTQCWGQSANPYSMSELRSAVNSPVTSISNVAVSNSNGTSTAVTFFTNRGTVQMSGYDFQKIYNMRAPSYLRIPQSGFVNINIEKK